MKYFAQKTRKSDSTANKAYCQYNSNISLPYIAHLRYNHDISCGKKEQSMSNKGKQKMDAKTKKKLMYIIIAAVLALIAIFKPEWLDYFVDESYEAGNVTATDATLSPDASSNDVTDDSGLYVAFIDVGQGDSIFLRSPSGKTLLVDAGTPDAFESIKTVLDENGVTKLDAVVMTHPHSDHMGSMKKVVENYDIGVFYMPDAVNTTSSFEKLITSLETNKVKTKTIWGGPTSTLGWDDDVEIRVLSPLKGNDYDLNNVSIVLHVAYKNTSLLLTGDAEKFAENLILEDEAELLKADVLKAGHHGSSTSSSQAFLDAVQPEVVILSLGKDNDYGHPHKETMERLNKLGVKIYRTDEVGTVEMLFTGSEVRLLSGK